MVRAVKSKPVRSLAKGQRAVLLPGPTEAEPWEVWILGGRDGGSRMVQVCQSPLDNRVRKTTTLALPVSVVYSLPLWLNETDSRQFAGIIPLQLELRGLQPRNEAAVFDWSMVAQEQGRTLVLVGILPASLPAELHPEAYESFDLSARYLAPAANALTLWQEQDRLVAGITRGANLAYCQALPEAGITPRAIQDLGCAMATLEMQDILKPLQRIVVRNGAGPEERAALQAAFNLPVVEEDVPSPKAPGKAWKLTPAAIGEARRTRESQRWMVRLAVVVLLAYMAAVGWLVTQYTLLSMKVAELRQWQAAHADAVQAVEDGRASWKALEPVTDFKHYPLELLWHVQQAIPPDVHLTVYEANSDGHLQIKGEAKNVSGAFTFFEKLQGDSQFTGYHLTMGNPRTMSNGLAQFQVEGTRATTNQ